MARIKPKDAKFLRNARQTKYRSIQTVIDGIKFASKKEANRYTQLKLLVKKGDIQNLELQVPFRLEVNGKLICRYVCDFQYEQNGKVTVEDVKGMITPIYRLKRKLMKAILDIEILET